MQIIGTTDSIEGLRLLLTRRRIDLGRSQLANDFETGFQDGYTGKLEVGAERGGRGVGSQSLRQWLQSLGVTLVVVAKDE